MYSHHNITHLVDPYNIIYFAYNILIIYMHLNPSSLPLSLTGFLRAGCLQCVFINNNTNNDTNTNNNNSNSNSNSTTVNTTPTTTGTYVLSPAVVVSDYTATCPITATEATRVLVRSCQSQGLGSAQGQGLGVGLGAGLGSETGLESESGSESETGPVSASGTGLGLGSGFSFPLKVVPLPVLTSVYPISGPAQGTPI